MTPIDPILHNHENRLAALEEFRRSLDESMMVMAEIERRQSAAIRANTEWLQEQSTRLAQREREQEEWKARHELLMKEFDEKLNGLIAWLDDFVRRNPPKNGK